MLAYHVKLMSRYDDGWNAIFVFDSHNMQEFVMFRIPILQSTNKANQKLPSVKIQWSQWTYARKNPRDDIICSYDMSMIHIYNMTFGRAMSQPADWKHRIDSFSLHYYPHDFTNVYLNQNTQCLGLGCVDINLKKLRELRLGRMSGGVKVMGYLCPQPSQNWQSLDTDFPKTL